MREIKSIIEFIFILILLNGCKVNNSRETKEKIKFESNKLSLLDSLKLICQLNTVDTFDIEKLKIDNFEKMIPIDKTLFQSIYPNRDDFTDSTFFIYSYLPSDNDYLTLIIYQKNYEGEYYRVDYVDMLNIDSAGRQLDKIRLTAKDNHVVTYKVVSYLNNDTLKIVEQISSEQYFDPNLDTLYTKQVYLKLNGVNRIDTLEIIGDFEVRKD